MYERSRELFERSQRVIPGGVNSPVRAFRAVGGTPIFFREGRGARLVLQVHDELLLEVPQGEVSQIRELVRTEMCGAYDLDPALAVDVGVGDNWADAKS